MNNLAYQEAANLLDAQLDRDLAALRARQDAGESGTQPETERGHGRLRAATQQRIGPRFMFIVPEIGCV